MEALTPTTLARPLDRNAMSNDVATLRQLAAELNNPYLTGAVVPEEEKAALAKPPPTPSEVPVQRSEPAPALIIPKLPGDRKAFALPPPPPKPLAPTSTFTLPKGNNRIFFTGHSKAGKSWLAAQVGARVIELEDPIRAMAASSFGSSAQPADLTPFFNEVFAWGEGTVNKSYPLTGARAMFIESIRSIKDNSLFEIPFEEFGTAGFWSRSLIARVAKFLLEFPREKVIVSDVFDADQYQALREGGFLAFHVLCNNITRTARGGTAIVNQLSETIERDLIKQVSAQPNGARLWAVWCDEHYAPPSGRLLTVNDFIAGASAL